MPRKLCSLKPQQSIKEPSRSGRLVYSTVPAARMVVGSNPEPQPMLVDMSASMWIKKAWLSCGPPYSQQVSHQRWIWGSHKQESTQIGIHSSFETQSRHHQKSKTGVSVAKRKGRMSSKKFTKKTIHQRSKSVIVENKDTTYQNS